MLKLIRLLLGLVVALFGAAFAYLNPADVAVHYYFGTLQLPLGVLILGLLGIGILVGILASLLPLMRARRENHRLHRKAELTGQEIRNLRSIPIKDR